MKTIADLFRPEPTRWGLRGDPYLWRAYADRFEATEMPISRAALIVELRTGFEELTGQRMPNQGSIFVEAFAGGGMSGGHVCSEFWRETAIPLILSRFDAVR